MSTITIAEAARRSGFPASTLRYYEDIGLVPPAGRTEAGYRVYDDAALARLGFVARSKQLGLTLEEVAEVLPAWEGDRCEPVQARLRDLVDGKLADAHQRIAELVALTADLQRAAAVLHGPAPDGPCDADCACAGLGTSPPPPRRSPCRRPSRPRRRPGRHPPGCGARRPRSPRPPGGRSRVGRPRPARA